MSEARELCIVILEVRPAEGRVQFEYHSIQHGAMQLCGRSSTLRAEDLDRTLKELEELRDQGQRQEDGKRIEGPFEKLEAQAREVFDKVGPAEGLAALLARIRGVGSRLVPQLAVAVSGAVANRIPWEMWRLECLRCTGCGQYHAARVGLPTGEPCISCGRSLASRNAALFDCAELSYVLPGQSASTGSAYHRDKFVIVVGQANDSEGAAFARHVDFVDSRARELFGNDAVEISEKSFATVKRFRALMREPDVRGLYYFGHADDRGLKLHGGEYLLVDEVQRAQPQIPFVFLNACYAASRDLAETPLALAFAGAGHLVVAPAAEVVSSHAADFAQAFFESVCIHRSSASEALSYAYRDCDERAEACIAGVYRRFGVLRTSLVPPRAVGRRKGIFSTPTSGMLEPKRFAFDVVDVLSHARQASGGVRIEAQHAWAGLLQRGPLTRHLVRGLVVQPDRLLEEIPALGRTEQRLEPKTGFGRESLSDTVQRALHDAQEDAALRGEEKVSERDVLQRLLQIPSLANPRFWSNDVTHADMSTCLRETYHSPNLDGGGALHLSDLADGAQRVVRRVVEQLERVQESRPRQDASEDAVWLWSFLAEPAGCAHEYCNACGIESNVVLHLLREKLRVPEAGDCEAPAASAALVSTVVAHAILPMLRMARVTGHRQITPHHLFSTYCKRASAKLKVTLEREVALVLNEFACKCLGARATMDELPQDVRDVVNECTNITGRAVLLRFWQLALELNSCSNRVLLAAFLDQDDETAARSLSARMAHATRKELSEFLAERSRVPAVLDRSILGAVIKSHVEKARTHTSHRADANTLYSAFEKRCPQSFVDALGEELPSYEWRVPFQRSR